MKTLLTPVILALAALALGATVVLTSAEPPLIWPAGGDVLTRQMCLSSTSVSIDPDKLGLLTSQFQSGSNPIVLPTGNKPGKSYIFTAPNPMPLLLTRQPEYQPLSPGVYQTYPWSIILVVPERGIDDRSVLNMQSTNSPMPAVTPPVQVLPKS